MATLRRELGVVSLSVYGVGLILGAGVYSVIGPAAGAAGGALWLAFGLAGGVALLTGLSYAELGAALPQAGAEYVYLQRAFPRLAALRFAAGIALALSGIATSATVASAFAGYIDTGWTSALVIAACCAANVAGLRAATIVTVLCTVIEIVGLLVVIGIGGAMGGELAAPEPFGGVVAAAALVFFAFLGFEDIANLAEEAKEPGRDLPRSILVSVTLTTALYVGVAIAVSVLIAPERIADSDAPLADAVRVAGPAWPELLRVIALFATANTALVAQLTAARMLLALARDRELPAPLARISGGVPRVATIVAAVAALLMLPLGETAILASVASMGALVGFTAVNVAVIALRRRAPELRRPFRVPGAIRGVPLLPAAGALSAVGLTFALDPVVFLVGAAVLGVAILVRARARGPRAPLRRPPRAGSGSSPGRDRT